MDPWRNHLLSSTLPYLQLSPQDAEKEGLHAWITLYVLFQLRSSDSLKVKHYKEGKERGQRKEGVSTQSPPHPKIAMFPLFLTSHLNAF